MTLTDSGKRVLVTGINGFTGRYITASLLEAGYQVFGTSAQAVHEAGVFQLDLCDREAVSRVVQEVQPNRVIHLAAVSFVGHGDPAAFYGVNLLGTRNLLSALADLDNPPEAVLLASSANVYGNAQSGVLDESAAVAPANDYAVSKLAMEHMASLWHDRLPIIITRPFNYTGVGQEEKFLIPKIVAHFTDQASVIELGNLDVWRDFSDVRALVAAYLGLLDNPLAIGQTVNVCSGVAVSLREVITMCESITGHSIKVQVNADFVRTNEVRFLCGNAKRLKMLVPNWQPIPFVETLNWMQLN